MIFSYFKSKPPREEFFSALESKEETEADFDCYTLVKKIVFILSKYHLDGLILKWVAHDPCFVNFILEHKSLVEDNEKGEADVFCFFFKNWPVNQEVEAL